MSVSPPPLAIASQIALWIPGIWPVFVAAANQGLAEGRATSVTSWWRSPEENRRVGGNAESQHLLALAFDATAASPQLLAQALRSAGFRVVEERTHVHAQAYQAGVLGRAGFFRALGLTST